MQSFSRVLPNDQTPWVEKTFLKPVRGLMRENCGVNAFGVKRRPTCAKEDTTPIPVHTSTIGRAASAAVSSPLARIDMAAVVLGCAMASMTVRRNEETRLAARPARR